MKIVKTSNYIGIDQSRLDGYVRAVNVDLTNIALALQGRIAFGSGIDTATGENIAGEFRVFTSSADAGTENTITHNLVSTPIGYIIFKQDKDSTLYAGASTWGVGSISLISSATSTAYTIFIIP